MKSRRKEKKIYKTTILFIVLDLLVASCFFIMYGPWSYIRNLFVTTAMQTMNHQYFAKVFYNDEKINAIQNSNYIITITEEVNTDEIIIDTREKEKYKDEYEEELLTRENPNDIYKVLNIKVGNAKGYLVAIYEPEKVRLIRAKAFNAGTYGERVVDMCKRYGGSVCINGGGFTNGLSNGSDIPRYLPHRCGAGFPEGPLCCQNAGS